MYTTKQAAKLAGIGNSTVTHYAREWADYLSPSATPDAGVTRIYTDDDIAVFKTIRLMRKQHARTEDIIATLDSGERYEPLEPQEPEDTPQDDETPGEPRALATMELLTQFVQPFQDRIAELETRLDQAQDNLIEAEKRATKAETLLEERERAAADEIETSSRAWWQVWKQT